MELTVLGSGSANQSKTRRCSGYLLKTMGKLFLIDAGAGVYTAMSEQGIDVASLDAIFISHMHIDHINDLPILLFARKHCSVAEKTLLIHGPEEFGDNLLQLLKAFGNQLEKPRIKIIEHIEKEVAEKAVSSIKIIEEKIDNKNDIYEEAHKEEEDEPDEVPIEKEKESKYEQCYGEYRIGLVGITALPMEHSLPSVGYRFTKYKQVVKTIEPDEADGEPEQVTKEKPVATLAYSGDTTPCDNLIKLAMNVDCLLMEATSSDEFPIKGHSTTSQSASVAKEAKVKTVLLTHISPENDETDMEREAGKLCDSIVIKVRDGMRITI